MDVMPWSSLGLDDDIVTDALQVTFASFMLFQ